MKLAHALLFLLFAAPAAAQHDCSPQDISAEAMLPLGVQNKLLAHKIAVDAFELEAPPDVSRDVVMLRKTLDIATQAFFRCVAGENPDPASLQAKLSAFLHTDRSKRDRDPNTRDGVYAANLKVHIEPAYGLAASVFVVLTFDIECGDDNLLFLYTRQGESWIESLRYYSDEYVEPTSAFGDFLTYTVAPGPHNQRLIAVVHGTPWCMSRMSSFHVDLLRPAGPDSTQQRLAHLDAGYSRSEIRMTRTSDGFQFRVLDDSLDFDNLFVRPRIFRFRTTSGSLQRIQPIADNARDFVDIWLQLQWTQSSRWAERRDENLHAIHDEFNRSNSAFPGVVFGPVRACGNNVFQVQITADKDRSLYAQVRQSSNSFTMLSITEKRNPACTGPDIMKKR